MLEDDVVDVIDEDDIPVETIDTSSIVEVVGVGVDNTSPRRDRRQRRATQQDVAPPPPAVPDLTQTPTNDGIVAEPLPHRMRYPYHTALNKPVVVPNALVLMSHSI